MWLSIYNRNITTVLSKIMWLLLDAYANVLDTNAAIVITLYHISLHASRINVVASYQSSTLFLLPRYAFDYSYEWIFEQIQCVLAMKDVTRSC